MVTAALLLTGGASRRLGTDKAVLVVDGQRLVDRTADLLVGVCDPVLEVGPGYGRLPAIREDPPGRGPLAATAAGAAALGEGGHDGPVIVLAVDLPGVTTAVLTWLRDHPAAGTVVPVVDDVAQVLCARYSPGALGAAAALVDRGSRSMHALLDAVPVHRAGRQEWGGIADPAAFTDIDSRADAAEAGIDLRR